MKKYLNAQKWLVVIENGYKSTQIYKSLKYPKIALDFLTRQLNDHFYSIKAYFVFFFFLLAGVSFSQSKKEQIEQLNYRVDSLNQIVVTESKINSENTNRIAQLLDTIVLLKSKLSSLNLDLSNSNTQLQNVKTDISEKEKQINSLKLSSQQKIDSLTNLSLNFQKENQVKIKEIDLLKVQIKAKADSLDMLRLEIEKFKLVKTATPKTTINPVK